MSYLSPYGAIITINKVPLTTYNTIDQVREKIVMAYDAQAFHPSFPKGKQSGQIWLDRNALHYRFGEVQGSMPLDGLQLRLGGARNRLVFFSHPTAEAVELYTTDRAILQHSAIQQHPELAAKAGVAKRKRVGQHMRLVVGILLMVAVPLCLIVRMDVLVKPVASTIPVSWEQSLAESGLAQYRLSHDLMVDDVVSPLLMPLITPLVEANSDSAYEYDFYIVNDASLNAFAMPGGVVVIHSGLVLAADDVTQLQGVIAHEISHVEQRHGLRNLLSSLGIYSLASLLLGDASGVIATLGSVAPFLLNQQYSRRFESEADKKGHDLLVQAHIDPAGLASFFEKMIEQERAMLEHVDDEKTRDVIEATLGFLSTHPSSQKRIDALRALTVPAMEFRDDSLAFSELQTAVAQFVSTHTTQQEQVTNEHTN